MSITTVASHFSVDAAPADQTVKLSGKGPQRLVLDILALEGGATPTVQVVMTELIQSTKEIQILSNDGSALDTFTAGRVVRGSQSGKTATVVSERSVTSGGVTTNFLRFVDTGPSKFFVGENIQEIGLTGAAIAAIAEVASLPSQTFIAGDEIADSKATGVDTIVDIAGAKRDRPVPHRPGLARLSYTFTGAPTSASFLVRVSD